MNIDQHYEVIRKLAIQHRKLTGHIISGLTGELGEWQTAKLLNLELTKEQNTPGYDAKDKYFYPLKYQIKSSTPRKLGNNGNAWHFSHVCTTHDWDRIVFCFMTMNYEVICIYRMDKDGLKKAQTKSGKKHKHIPGNRILRFGSLVYRHSVLYSKYIISNTILKPTSSLSRQAFIKSLLQKGHTNTSIIIDILAINHFDISNLNSIRSNISQLKKQLK